MNESGEFVLELEDMPEHTATIRPNIDYGEPLHLCGQEVEPNIPTGKEKNMSKKKTSADLPPLIQENLSSAQKKAVDLGLSCNRAFLINGPQGPTGKSTLKRALRSLGAQAFEPHEIVEITLSTPIENAVREISLKD